MKTTLVSLGLAMAVALGMVACMDADAGPKSKTQAATGQLDTKPGPAHRVIDGKLSSIDGPVYVVEDYTGTTHRIYVSNQTVKIRAKKPGDSIRAELTRGNHANSIQ